MARELKPLAVGMEHDCGWIPSWAIHNTAYLVCIRHDSDGTYAVIARPTRGEVVTIMRFSTLERAIRLGEDLVNDPQPLASVLWQADEAAVESLRD